MAILLVVGYTFGNGGKATPEAQAQFCNIHDSNRII
jgi:hypothetical protein